MSNRMTQNKTERDTSFTPPILAIAVIQGYASMLSRWGKSDPDVLNEGINAIAQETESMKELVESLLFHARC